jgi:hypothetical protein
MIEDNAVGSLPLVGLAEPEIIELRRSLDRPVLPFETMPRIRVNRGRLLVEEPRVMNAFVPVERIVSQAIFEDEVVSWGVRDQPVEEGA